MDAPDKPNRLHKFVSYIVLYNMLWYPMSKFYVLQEGDGENTNSLVLLLRVNSHILFKYIPTKGWAKQSERVRHSLKFTYQQTPSHISE